MIALKFNPNLVHVWRKKVGQIGAIALRLSRLQFGATTMHHFMFVPLTLGLSWRLVIMESLCVMTGKLVDKDMTQL